MFYLFYKITSVLRSFTKARRTWNVRPTDMRLIGVISAEFKRNLLLYVYVIVVIVFVIYHWQNQKIIKLINNYTAIEG